MYNSLRVFNSRSTSTSYSLIRLQLIFCKYDISRKQINEDFCIYIGEYEPSYNPFAKNCQLFVSHSNLLLFAFLSSMWLTLLLALTVL